MTRLVSLWPHVFPLALGIAAGYAALGLITTLHAADPIPDIHLTAPTEGATVSGAVNVTAAASAPGIAALRFQVDGVDLGGEITSGNCSANWNSLAATDGPHAVTAIARDDDGNTSVSSVAVTVTNGDPVISELQAWNVLTTGASITWKTSHDADSRADFGLSTDYDQAAADSNTVTLHTLVLKDLKPATPYHVRVRSTDVLGRVVTSDDMTFTTADVVAAPPLPTDAVVNTPDDTDDPMSGKTTIVPRVLSQTVTGDSTSMTISWITDQSADAQVEYGSSIVLGKQTAIDTTMSTTHVATITGLQTGKTYFFHLRSRNARGMAVTSPTLKFVVPDGR